MIVTCKKEIPPRWIAFTILPWASVSFNFAVVSAAFVFSLKKFAENPAGLTLVLSLPGFIAIIVAPLASFLSDRVWTRFGRRKPFVLAGAAGMITALVLMPLMPNLWSLIGAYLLYHVSDAFSSPRDPLKQEIVPPSERGRATGAMTWCQNLAIVAFYSVMLGRFDDVGYFAGFPLQGEKVIYWSAALLLATMLLLVALGIKEVDQKSPLRGQTLSLRNLAGGLFDQELWPVYLLVVSFELLNFFSGFGPFLSTLLYTDQWGYTKQEMGANVAIGGVVNIFIIGLLTFFADRLPRMRAFRTLICLSLSWNIVYFFYVNFVLPDKRPTLIEIIVFGEVLSILSILLGLVYTPLIYDYVRRNKMGTFSAGVQIATRGIRMITLNGVGLFVWGYALVFQPAAGEMTRVVLRESTDRAALTAALQPVAGEASVKAPGKTNSSLVARPWQADGVLSDHSRSWEIRSPDRDSEGLAERKTRLEREQSRLLADMKRRQDDATVAKNTGREETFRRTENEAEEKRKAADELSPQIAQLEAELVARAGKWRDQVVARLGNRIVGEGDQLVDAKISRALLVELATADRPDQRALEKMIDDLRQEFPAVIDLRPLKRDPGYGLTIGAVMEPGSDENDFAHQIQSALIHVASRRAPGLLAGANSPLTRRIEPAVTLELQVIEQPVVTYVSPVSRLVQGVQALFDAKPEPGYRLSAIARNLRSPEETNQVRVVPGRGERTITITAIMQSTAARARTMDDSLGTKLNLLLGPGTEQEMRLQARAFCDRVEQAAAGQRITVVRPVLTASYAPLRYDYMSGYLWVFFVGLIGIAMTFVFSRLERTGRISKRGVEEATG